MKQRLVSQLAVRIQNFKLPNAVGCNRQQY